MKFSHQILRLLEKDFYERALQQKASGGAGLEKGASLAVFLGSAGSDGITGKLISAIWDPWEELDRYKADLGGFGYLYIAADCSIRPWT